MNIYAFINTQMFAEDGAAGETAGGGAETGTAAGTGTESMTVNVGDTLADGTQVQDAQVAAAMNRRLKQKPELRDAFFGQKQTAQGAAEVQTPAEPTQDERWESLRKGEFKAQYDRDVQAAIRNRFKNQEDANAKLSGMQPMLDALMQKSGAKSVEELQQMILDDDSLYEDEAEERGLTVEQLKQYKAMEAENSRLKQAEERANIQQHITGLQQQAEALKQMFPEFDLQTEMQNEQFMRLTAPGGLTLEQAYMAMHGKDLIPQLMAYGMQRAQQQMGQTIQAQRMRPAEGAMSGKNPAAAEPRINPAKLTRKEMKRYKELIRMDKFTSFDR